MEKKYFSPKMAMMKISSSFPSMGWTPLSQLEDWAVSIALLDAEGLLLKMKQLEFGILIPNYGVLCLNRRLDMNDMHAIPMLKFPGGFLPCSLQEISLMNKKSVDKWNREPLAICWPRPLSGHSQGKKLDIHWLVWMGMLKQSVCNRAKSSQPKFIYVSI